MTTGYDSAARAAVHPIPEAMLGLAHRTPDGRLLLALQLRCDVGDALRAGDIVVADASRPGFRGPGVYLVVWCCRGELLIFVGHTDPETKRGALRREIRRAGIRWPTGALGVDWWAVRIHEAHRVRYLDAAQTTLRGPAHRHP